MLSKYCSVGIFFILKIFCMTGFMYDLHNVNCFDIRLLDFYLNI